MRRARFELGFTRNRKVKAMSDAAFRLWVSCIDHAAEQRTDGTITDDDLDDVPGCPRRGPRRSKLLGELVALRGLETANPGLWVIHGFLEWQESKARVDELARRARERMALVRANTGALVRPNDNPTVRPNDGELFARTTDPCSPEVRSNTHTRAQVCPSDLISGSDLKSGSGSDPSQLFAKDSDRLRARGPKRAAPMTALPEPFPLTDEHRKYAAGKAYPAWWMENRHEHFCELAGAKSWKYSDWNRAFYTFLRNEIGYRRGPEDLAHLAPRTSQSTATEADVDRMLGRSA